MNKFVYSLRIGICPGFDSEEKFEQLLAFCREAGIDDIQFHMNMEEVNQGHLTPEETEPWLEMLATFKERLSNEGIGFSLNPWTTTLHTDRGRKLKPGQDFTTMRDHLGRDAEAVACPLCDNFTDYLTSTYARYAELGFDTIWVEDDFRLHNHAPLAWGGCFCDKHMALFSEEAGRKLIREEFVQEIVQPGLPHPSRKVWLDVMGRTMADFGRKIGDAVLSNAPGTRIALMSSAPQAHSVEGRDWDLVMKNMMDSHRYLDRPHLPAYREIAGPRYCLEFQRYSRLTAAFVPEQTELWPELDNFPHTTFSKSHSFAAFQIEASLTLCSEGIAINIFDMIGNGIAGEQKNHSYLKRLRPYLNGVAGLGMRRQDEMGVRVMVNPRSSYTLKTDGGKTPDAIRPWETFWAEYLSALGIANCYCTDPEVTGETIAVGGQYFRNLTESQITVLLRKNRVLLDGEAVDTLMDMGLAYLLPIQSTEWHRLNSGCQSYEQVCNGEDYHGLTKARMSVQGMSESIETGDWLEITYDTEPEMITNLHSPEGNVVGPGIVIHKNLIIFPFGRFRDDYLSFLHPVRQEILQQILQTPLKPFPTIQPPVMVKDLPYVTVNHFEDGTKNILLLANFGSDHHDFLDLHIPFSYENAFMISKKSGETEALKWELTEDGFHRLNYCINPRTTLCMVFLSFK
jgi:hypothetical protein